jgi:hypothetical protein
MQHAEKELQDAIVEDSSEETVSRRHRTQAIPMTQTEHLTPNLDKSRLHHTFHAKLLKIAVGPHVMITLEEEHLHAPVHKALESSEHSYVPLRNNVTILVPEIPYVSEQIHSIRLLRKRVQKVGKTTLACIRIRNPESKMHVRNEICEPT